MGLFRRIAGRERRGRSRGAESGSFIVDRRGTLLGFDGGMESLTGWPAVEIVGHSKKLERLLTPDTRGDQGIVAAPLYDGDLVVPNKSSRSRELRLHCRDGSSILVEAVLEHLPGPGERVLVRVLRVLARSAPVTHGGGVESFDELTGLLDHAAFSRRLDQEFSHSAATAQPLAVIVIDVDHLRKINDRFGHKQGNEVLKRLAGILRVTLGGEDRLARIGGDEFATILPGSGRGEARQLAAGLRSTVERSRFSIEGNDADPPRVTLSIGASSFPADADNARDLMDRARDALDEARSLGRNRVWCYMRRPRVPVEVPVYFDAAEALLVGYTRDLSPSGVFVQTAAPMDIDMRCALAFPLPGHDSKVHVIGRVVRAVPAETATEAVRIPGMGVEFERFGGPNDRRAIEAFLHQNESKTLRPENGILSV